MLFMVVLVPLERWPRLRSVKLILVGSAPFEEKYATKILETHLSRLSADENKEVLSLLAAMNSNDIRLERQ